MPTKFIFNLILLIGSPAILGILLIWAYLTIKRKERRTKLKWSIEAMFDRNQ